MRRNRRKERKAVPLLDLHQKRVVRIEEQGEELFPGIPNEITLNQILMKLPHWRDFHILSSLNRGWLQAIRSRQVYEARVRSNSTETLAVIHHDIDSSVCAIALYSVRDESLYYVPPIPQIKGIPAHSQCVSMDGKLFVLGGVKNSQTGLASNEVYVLDLAGQRGWRRCANMQQPRQQFGCGIINRKIYVCGGLFLFAPIDVLEVYDPEVDAWSPLPPMYDLRFDHRVATFGEQLIVQGGFKYTHYEEETLISFASKVKGRLWEYCGSQTKGLDMYKPIKEKWYWVMPFSRFTATDLMFTKERIYAITWSDIHVEDNEDTWAHLHSLSSESSMKSRDADYVMPIVPVVIDDELLTVVHWAKSRKFYVSNRSLVRSKGFCSGKKEIVWEEARWSR